MRKTVLTMAVFFFSLASLTAETNLKEMADTFNATLGLLQIMEELSDNAEPLPEGYSVEANDQEITITFNNAENEEMLSLMGMML